MLVLALGSGNHSNRLFQNIHFEAFCKEKNIEYINPSFFDMYKYYIEPCKISKGIKGLFFLNNFFIKILRKLKLLKIISFDNELQDNETLLLSPASHDTYVGGWHFRVHNLTEKYQEYFIKRYSLKEKYYKNNKMLKKIFELKNKNIFVIGIHIRKGDYKYWNDGKYYFNEDIYLKYMQNIKDEIHNKYNKECYFIIFSNENITINENPNIIISKNEWYIDHFLMGKCDILIGPPSTFTLWASYIGKVKYYHIENDSGEISLEKFNLCKG